MTSRSRQAAYSVSFIWFYYIRVRSQTVSVRVEPVRAQ